MYLSGKDVFRLRLFESQAGVFPFSLVGKKWTPICVENKDLLRNHIDELSQLLFALADLFLGPFSVGDIANGAGNQHSFLSLQRAEADLHRKLPSFFMQTVQFQPGPHWPRVRVGRKTRAVSGMFTPKPLRYEHLDLVSQYLLSLIAKQLLHLRIDQNNFALTIHYHDRIGRRLQQVAESLFGLLAIFNVRRGPVPLQDLASLIS